MLPPEHDDLAIQPQGPPSRTSIGNLGIVTVFAVAFFAFIASGSCAGYANSTTDAYYDGESRGVGSVFLPSLLSAGLALAVSLGFVLLAQPRPAEAGLYVASSATAYVAGMLASWIVILVPAVVAVAVIIAGGLIARRIMSDHVARSRWKVAAISSCAIALATLGFVGGFWANYDLEICWFGSSCGDTTFNAIPFAIVAGSVPPFCAAVATIRVRDLYNAP